MSEPTPRFWEVFFELYAGLPRQGPGSRACAVRALDLCRDLPQTPAVLDLGCGVGGQTLHLAELTHGSIVAIDRHAPSIERLETSVAERGLGARVRPVVGDMAQPGMPPETCAGARDASATLGLLRVRVLRGAPVDPLTPVAPCA